MRNLFLLVCLLIGLSLNAEFLTYNKVLKNLKGIKEYKNDNFQRSEELFNDNSVSNPRDGRLHYNKANSQYKNCKLEDAEQEYNLALRDNNFANRSEIYHNLGNIKFQQQDYKEAIKLFRNALIEDPANQDARYNYELASRFLQQSQQQQQQQSQDQQNENEQQDEQQQQQQQKNDEQQDQEDKQKEQQQQEQKSDEQKQEEQQQQQKMKEDEKKKEEAEQMLKTLLQKEKEEMKKQKMKMNVDKSKKGKYW
jgi:Ca-activated chloride channel homolog